jgi:hypothetical protein
MTATNISTISKKWKLSRSGYVNAPFVIYQGDKAPDYNSAHPLQGVDVIAEVPHDEGPLHKVQQDRARLLRTSQELFVALRNLVESLENGVIPPLGEAAVALHDARRMPV